MSPVLLAVCAIAVGIGAIAQRITGLGFALVCSPFLIMALGPIEGVVVANLCGFASGMLSLLFTWRQVDVKRTIRIGLANVIGFLPGMLVIRVVPQAWLAVLVASIVLVALLITLTVRPGRTKDSLGLSTFVGTCSGFMAVTASVGGPPLAIYGRLTAWDHREFAASMQAMTPFILIAIVSAPSFPNFTVAGWATIGGALLGGVLLGTRLAPHVSAKLAGRLVMITALAGTLLALGRALYQLAV